MPRPRMALPQRAAHVLGSTTGRLSSPGGRRSWGRGRGMLVCRSSCVRTWGTAFSCQQPSTMRRDPLHITHSGMTVQVAAAIQPTRACARVVACLSGSQTRATAATPGSGGTKICTNQVQTPCDVVLTGADHGLSACIADHLVVPDCVIPGIKHHAPRAVRPGSRHRAAPPCVDDVDAVVTS